MDAADPIKPIDNYSIGFIMNLLSLGHNCEVAYQLDAYRGYPEASFFNWLVTPLSSLVSTINNNFEKCFELEDLEWDDRYNGVHNKRTGITYHRLFPKDSNNGTLKSTIKHFYPEKMKKISHLTEKWRTQIQQDNLTIVRLGIGHPDKMYELHSMITSIRSERPFRLFWISRPENEHALKCIPGIEYRIIPAATEGEVWKGDGVVWRDVLNSL